FLVCFFFCYSRSLSTRRSFDHVTVAVFAPLIFVGGMVGELFIPFALTMTFALGASLLVAVTIVPALSHTLFKKKLYAEKETQKQDRKSTRLNSSHVSISYAVFC